MNYFHQVYLNNNPDFEYKSINGGHHVHMDNAPDVASIVQTFLDKKFKGKGTEDKENMPFKLWNWGMFYFASVTIKMQPGKHHVDIYW